MFLLLTLNIFHTFLFNSASIADFEKVNIDWVLTRMGQMHIKSMNSVLAAKSSMSHRVQLRKLTARQLQSFC